MIRSAPIVTVNPTTGERMDAYFPMGPAEVAEILRRADESCRGWKEAPFGARAVPMKELAKLLREGAEDHVRRMAIEMGKPILQGRLEVEKCAWACDYFAENAERMLLPEFVLTGEGRRSYVAFRPLGVVLGIMPWNFPYWQVFRFAVPSLMAGNAVLVKHASNVPKCAAAIERLFVDSGFPPDLFRALFIGPEEVDGVIESPFVRAVSLTGSTGAGKAVAAKAGSLVKKTVLELGGSDPYLILEDADLGSAARICASARLINSGQSCIAAKRFVVVDAVRESFERLLVEELAKKRVGDPLDPATEVGPLARHDLRDALHRQVTESLARGARLLLGGEVPRGPGAFYPPTVLASVSRGMPAYEEELFGPVAAVIPARGEEEAVEIANDSVYGLGAAVFTRDLARGERVAARELDAGNCFVNGTVSSDPRMPFGGVKGSGYGRELSHFGIREFVNIKTVVVDERR